MFDPTKCEWWKRNAHRIRAVAGFAVFNLLTSASPSEMLTWQPKRWALGVLVALVLGIKAGEYNNAG